MDENEILRSSAEMGGAMRGDEEAGDGEGHRDSKQCRTCLRRGERKLLTLTDTLANMINDLTQLNVTPEDGFTQWVCSGCHKEINRSHKFRKMCLDSMKLLEDVKINQCISQIKKEEPLEDEQKVKLDVDFEPMDSKNEDDDSDDEHKFEMDVSFKLDEADAIEKDSGETRIRTIFSCPYCQAPFGNMKIFSKHMDILHPDKKDDDVRALIDKSSPLGYIYKKKDADDEYKCSCGVYTASKYSDIIEHFKTHFGDRPIACWLCDFRCSTVGPLKKHIKTHNPDKPFACTLCDFACKKKYGLQAHMITHSDEKNFHCDVCPCTFKCATGLNRHKAAVHEKKKNHMCQHCDKKFFSTSELKLHLAVHTGEKRHICHLCGQAFSQAANLKTHIMAIHESDEVAKRFKCDICGFTSKHNLYRHMIRHTGVKDHKCDQCPFLTNSPYTLKIHMLRHAGETRFSCDLCDYKCLDRRNLTIHQVTHTGEKNFHCDLCVYAGATRGALKRHKETHSTELKYSCPHCPYKTNVRDILTSHIRKKCPSKKEESEAC